MRQTPARAAHIRRRRGWPSPLTRRILLLNVLVLVIPILGLLHLDQYRQSLIESELDSLRVQARSFALSLGTTAVVATPDGEERLVPEMARHLMRVLLADTGVRARIFNRKGTLVADSYVLTGSGGPVQVVELPPPDEGTWFRRLERLYERAIEWLPSTADLPEYHEARYQRASDYPEVVRALNGEAGGAVRVARGGRLILTYAVPVQRYRQVLGALMVSKDGADINAAVRARRLDILLVFAAALAVTVLLSFYLASTIARPIRQLAEAAKRVRHGQGRQQQIPDFTGRGDEIGELSAALRDMTEALWRRLDAIEGFAADVAHEIKNPLTSLRSAVETVARIKDPEQQKRLMTIILEDVQRLDRLISDISDASRLDAELSRSRTEQVDLAHLLRGVVEAHNATAREGQPRFRLELPPHDPLFVPGIEDRLGQVVRNLINNAISFSPPGGTITLTARRRGDTIELTIADEGPGIPDNKLEAIFDRFYSERPQGEKFGTHSGLGLSISKQIVEAHGGTIHAENIRDADGHVRGARFVVCLPAE
ncbi:MAG: HAMP domain-containing protein [Alphaproteobacteria bacterium]|nr:MAG: HAMP domain-containing protein [Alphaproteobacteria bacterium]